MKRIEAVNDFVIKFANVNGSGSVRQRAVRQGDHAHVVPVAPRNIFPSNIRALPTWYEARVCGEGLLGRRGGVDMMVAMNPQTWDAMRPNWRTRHTCFTTARAVARVEVPQ